MMPLSDWYAAGWHWLGTLFARPAHTDADVLEGAPRLARPQPREGDDDYFLDVRHRMQNRF